MAIKRIKKEEVKKVSVNFKSNVLTYLAEVIANSAMVFSNNGIEIEDISSLPTEVKIVKTTREPVLVFNVSDIQIKASVSVPKSAVTGEVLAIATSDNTENDDDEEEADTDENEAEDTDTNDIEQNEVE